MLQSLWRYIKRHPRVYGVGAVTAILSGILAIIPNYILQLFIDRTLAGQLSQSLLIRYLTTFALVSILTYACDYIWGYLLFNQAFAYEADLRESLFSRLVRLRAPFYQRFRSGDLMTRLTSDIQTLGSAIGWGFVIVVADGTWMVSVLLIMFLTISWRLSLISVLPLILFGIVIYYLGNFVNRRYEKARDAKAQLNQEVLEQVDGIRVYRSYGNQKLERVKFQAKTANAERMSNGLVIGNASFGQVAQLFTGISMALGLVVGGLYVQAGSLTVGQLVSFQLYLSMLNGTVWGMADLVAIFQQGSVSYDKVEELLQADDQVEKSGQLPMQQIDRIDWQDYVFSYPDSSKAILGPINLSLERGQTLGIIGPTGSGKSSLIYQILRQYPVGHQGQLLINGRPIEDYDLQDLQSLVAYVPQDHILFSKTVQDNILFGAAKEQAQQESLDQAIDLADFRKDLPNLQAGLDTLVGEKGLAISGGQKQRIAIARALIKEADLLILDDSLSAVDAKTEQAIIANIQQVRQNRTNIIISHRLSSVMEADQIIVLDQGQIIERGTAQELMELGGWFYEQHQLQQKGAEDDAGF